jgi:hypothetical protein
MKELFELEWMGGAAEHHYRKAVRGVDDLPWGTLDTRDYAPDVLEAARATWTRSSLTEYRAVAGFSEVLRTSCEAKAPLDVIGMASSFVADEVLHTELASRMAMELGGGTPLETDLDVLFPSIDRKLTAFQRANEAVLRVSGIAEAFSTKMAAKSFAATTHPLTRAVLERIVADESLHYRLGGVYFDWATESMDDAERERLGKIATECLRPYATTAAARSTPDPTATGRSKATLEQIRSIGWIDARVYCGHVRDAVQTGVVAPLAKYGIVVPAETVDAWFGTAPVESAPAR